MRSEILSHAVFAPSEFCLGLARFRPPRLRRFAAGVRAAPIPRRSAHHLSIAERLDTYRSPTTVTGNACCTMSS